MQFGIRPGLGQQPRHIGWPSDIEATVYEDARDVGELLCLGQQFAALEPRGMTEVMSAEAGAGPCEKRGRVGRGRVSPPPQGEGRVLPVAPTLRRLTARRDRR